MYDKPEPPSSPDHYAVLGLCHDATDIEVKKAFRKLSLKHHPDKQAPGGVVDAVEFRKIREAYEVLTNSKEREIFQNDYPNIHEDCAKYYLDLERWERCSAAEAEAKAAYARAKREREKERRAAKADEQESHNLFGINSGDRNCRGCIRGRRREHHERPNGTGIPTQDEYAAYVQLKAEEAETRSREAMRKRREEQEREATEHLRKEAEKAERVKKSEERKRVARSRVKDERSKEAARRAREQQAKHVQMRMAREHIKTQQEQYLRANESEKETPSAEAVIDIKWTKKKGAAKCLFCDAVIKYYAFVCPNGGAVACNPDQE